MIDQLSPSRTVSRLARLASAASLGVGFGVLTLWLQGRLSESWNVLANSGAVWTVVAVLCAAVLATTRGESVAASLLALVGEVAGYYWCAAPWHGIAVTQDEQVLWTAAAVVIGPLAGLAAHAVARGDAAARATGLLAIAGVVVGEGLFGLHWLAEHRAASWIEVVLGGGLATGTLLVTRAPAGRRAGALAVGALVAAAVLLAYSNPALL